MSAALEMVGALLIMVGIALWAAWTIHFLAHAAMMGREPTDAITRKFTRVTECVAIPAMVLGSILMLVAR